MGRLPHSVTRLSLPEQQGSSLCELCKTRVFWAVSHQQYLVASCWSGRQCFLYEEQDSSLCIVEIVYFFWPLATDNIYLQAAYLGDEGGNLGRMSRQCALWLLLTQCVLWLLSTRYFFWLLLT